MQPEIRTIPDMRMIYADGKGFDGSFKPAADEAFGLAAAYIEKHGLMPRLGLCVGFTPDDMRTTPPEQQRYRACFEIIDNDALPADPNVKEGTVEGGKMAVFAHRGPYEGLPRTWQLVMEEWIPASGLQYRHAMPFEAYVTMPGEPPGEEGLTEIYIPIE